MSLWRGASFQNRSVLDSTRKHHRVSLSQLVKTRWQNNPRQQQHNSFVFFIDFLTDHFLSWAPLNHERQVKVKIFIYNLTKYMTGLSNCMIITWFHPGWHERGSVSILRKCSTHWSRTAKAKERPARPPMLFCLLSEACDEITATTRWGANPLYSL